MKTKLTLVATFFMILLSVSASASDITAEDVINRYIEALGGAEVMSKYESRHITGTFEQSGMKGDLNVYYTASQDYRAQLTLAGVGEFEEGVFEGSGWTYDSMSGPQLMTGVHLESSLMRNRYNVELDYIELYDDVVYEGDVEFAGVLCHKLKFVASWGSTHEYFVVATGLSRGWEGELPIAGGMQVKFKMTVGEYKKFDGRLYQTKTVQESPMGVHEITVTQVTHGQVEAEQVQPPEAVKPILP